MAIVVTITDARGNTRTIDIAGGEPVSLAPGETIKIIGVTIEQVRLVPEGDDLQIYLPDGEVVVLAEFIPVLDGDDPPVLAIGGEVIADLEELFDQMAPAAGTASGGPGTNGTFRSDGEIDRDSPPDDARRVAAENISGNAGGTGGGAGDGTDDGLPLILDAPIQPEIGEFSIAIDDISFGVNVGQVKWGLEGFGTPGGIVTWSFQTHIVANREEDNPVGVTLVPLSSFMPAGFEADVRAAFDAWEAVTNIHFVEIADGGGDGGDDPVADIRIAGHVGFETATVLAHGFFPGRLPAFGTIAGDIHFDTDETWSTTTSVTPGGIKVFNVMLHELGHALGLGHSDESLVTGIMNPNYNAALNALQPDDIEGIQEIYGEPDNSFFVREIFGSNASEVLFGTFNRDAMFGGFGADLLLGSGGDDFLDGGPQDDRLFGGTGNDFIAGRAGNDFIDGGTGDDLIAGGIGFDTIDYSRYGGSIRVDVPNNGVTGAAGIDGIHGIEAIIGTSFDDLYILGSDPMVIIESPGGGIDKITSELSTILPVNVENLELTGNDDVIGVGNAANNLIEGNRGDNRLIGGAGNDVLIGGPGRDSFADEAGDDTFDGGSGIDLIDYSSVPRGIIVDLDKETVTGATGTDVVRNINRFVGTRFDDLYILGDTQATIIESPNGGTDHISSSLDIFMPANVEEATLTGTRNKFVIGNSLDNVITGNSAAPLPSGIGNDGRNFLSGGAGNDVIFGNGGADTLDGGSGEDHLQGGTGSDTYEVDSSRDNVVEVPNEGIDRVRSTVSHTLAANVEILELLGSANLSGTGNELNNNITGNSGGNTLNGKSGNDFLNGGAGTDLLVGDAGNDVLLGGTGADILLGGTGNDTYIVDNSGDLVGENLNSGIDHVFSSVTFDLDAGPFGRHAENLTLTGTGRINGSGNALNNQITGGSGNNVLSGDGGNDTLRGNDGNDILHGNDGNDFLFGGDDIDVLFGGNGHDVLAGDAGNDFLLGGSGNDNLSGGTGHDILSGETGNDTLDGGAGNDRLTGGNGADRLTGGSGRDTFDYNNFLELGDTITDFAKGQFVFTGFSFFFDPGDVLDISDVLDGFGDPVDPFGGGFVDFVNLGNVFTGLSTRVNVDIDGTGGIFGPFTLATLEGVHLTEADTGNYIL